MSYTQHCMLQFFPGDASFIMVLHVE